MNINDYRRAMDQIVPDTELKERIMNRTQPQKRYLPLRRAVNVLLAAALAVACLFTVALAASPELRTVVLSFFRMAEREQVPSSSGTPGGPDISQAEIGELVKAKYIRLDSRQYRYSGGNLISDQTWSEDWKTLVDAKFWEIKDTELVPIQIDMKTSKIDITFRNIHYQGEFYWFVHQGQLYFYSGNNRAFDEDGEHEWDWNLTSIPGRTDVLLLRLSIGRQMEYTEYPFLYHLDTGAAEDILAGTGVDQLECLYGFDWSENMRRAILLTGNGLDDQQTWFCDLDTKKLVKLDELVDIDVYTAAFADNDTLVLHSTTRDDDGILQDVSFYAYDIPSGTLAKTLEQTPYYHDWDERPSGVMTFGSRCVIISETGQVQVVDLKTGTRSLLGGFTFQKGDSFQLNPLGNKLLYFSMNNEIGGLGIAQLGVADLEKGIFFAFDREGYENLHEEGIGWQDDNTVSINATTPDGETRYLILYQF